MDRVGAFEQVTHQGMATFVVGDGVFDPLVEDAALALGASNHALERLVHLAHRDDLLRAPRRKQRRFVHKVSKVGARKARRNLGDSSKVNVV